VVAVLEDRLLAFVVRDEQERLDGLGDAERQFAQVACAITIVRIGATMKRRRAAAGGYGLPGCASTVRRRSGPGRWSPTWWRTVVDI
jgi:hypothetical protein